MYVSEVYNNNNQHGETWRNLWTALIEKYMLGFVNISCRCLNIIYSTLLNNVISNIFSSQFKIIINKYGCIVYQIS